MSRPAVFLDRDGVLVHEVHYAATGEWDAPRLPDDVQLIEGAAAAVRRLAENNFALVVISNQAAYAKGKTTLRNQWITHQRFVALLEKEGVRLDDVFYAYGHPEGIVPHFSGPSLDRKPSPHNLFVAAARHDLDLSRSWMIGDRVTDVECALAGGVRPIVVRNALLPPQDVEGVPVAQDLGEAVSFILDAD